MTCRYMDDSRQLFVDHVKTLYRHDEFRIDEENPRWDKRIYESLLDSVFYTICAYIRRERDADKEWGMGNLEREFLCSREFMDASDERKWIDENRKILDDTWLVVYIFDNVKRMTPGSHRRALLYMLNILYFDL